MRITQVLCRQHIGRMFKRHWEVQGKRRVQETGVAKDLLAMGRQVTDSKEFFVNLKKQEHANKWVIISLNVLFINLCLCRPRIQVDNIFEKPLEKNEYHPEYQQREIYLYGDSNVLLQGVSQAQVGFILIYLIQWNCLNCSIFKVLLKTVVFDKFPDRVEEMFQNLKLPSDVERSMQQATLVSHLLDAEQRKTIKIVNPLRPMRPYPRNYGISEARKK